MRSNPQDKIQLIDTEKSFHDKEYIETYGYEFSSLEDTVSLMLYLEGIYGVIHDVYFYTSGESSIGFFEEFDSIEEFRDKFTEEKFKSFGSLLMECRDRWISIRLEHDFNTVRVHNAEALLGKKEHDPQKIQYYKDSDGNVIKYDGNDQGLYVFSQVEGRWKHARYLRYSFCSHDDSEYELIENYRDPTIDNH